MPDTSDAERRVLVAALAFGLAVAVAASAYIGQREGVDIGIAVFVLSWTLVALFALVVRFLYLRLAGQATHPPDSPQPSTTPTTSRRARKRRRR